MAVAVAVAVARLYRPSLLRQAVEAEAAHLGRSASMLRLILARLNPIPWGLAGLLARLGQALAARAVVKVAHRPSVGTS